jgi:hypothetical protein
VGIPVLIFPLFLNMPAKAILLLLSVSYLLQTCTPIAKPIKTRTKDTRKPAAVSAEIIHKGLLDSLLKVGSGRFAPVFSDPEAYNLQILYTSIRRTTGGKVTFTDHHFNLDRGRYFYPASTVKLPVAILALQRLRELNRPGLDRNSTMVTDAAYPGQTPVFNDPSSADGRPDIAHYIKKILLVSDNDAYNRLYEFLGPEYINRELKRMGYADAEIIHRLEVNMTEDQNRHTNPVRFYDADGKLLYAQAARYDTGPYTLRHDSLGKAYIQGGKLRKGPMDFSRKNRIGLMSLHNILRAVMYPESVPAGQRFNISDDDLAFIRRYMSAMPSSTGFPSYDPEEYYDTYCKFLLFGAEKTRTIPPQLKVYNKVGDAYGHLLDIACFQDSVRGVEFMVSAVVYCNSDGTLNDDRYDYDDLGFPLLKYIGERIYAHELAESKGK